MTRIECPREGDVLMMVSTGRWPDRAPADLREHAEGCDVCRDLAVAAAGMDELASMAPPVLPSSGTVWWRAQLRARREAARDVVRPITAAQALAFAAAVGVAGAVFGATAEWFQSGLRAFGGASAGIAAHIRLPQLPALPSDLSAVSPGYWIILLVAGIGLVAGAAILGWAMKEE